MSINQILVTSLSLSVLLHAGPLTIRTRADDRLNVLWVMADDLRPQLGCYGDAVAKSPNIDRFATAALRPDHAYAQSAVCIPSRNSLLIETATKGGA